ncbi:uncharacterized protein LOC121871554 [Homarus americanus]|uniref:uncharacterized protein LOC121871554 n=1 Tax=Homarus americanus TaxID=6706 RepID=UPI001C44AB77|nr:uncharacterized protein LOC121871554 [Homarus americanus]
MIRRGLLSIVRSVYDPLGFISPFIVKAKIIFQNECRRQENWDIQLLDHNLVLWQRWLSDLKLLQDFQISCCYTQAGLSRTASAPLHHFCDASQSAYAVVTYLRTVDQEGKIECSFVCGRARLAPIKIRTIPRLELCAAVLAAHADTTVRRELGVPLEDYVFWTDSMIVLKYIGNAGKRFHTFVVNRVSAVREVTDMKLWRRVSSEQNPVNDATRGVTASQMLEDCVWTQGPRFIRLPPEYWPKAPQVDRELEGDPEMKRGVTSLTSIVHRT